MANTPLEDLAAAITKAAANGPVALNKAFIDSANGNLNPPTELDKMLSTAWRLATGVTGLELTIQASQVGPVKQQQFQVTQAQITQGFLNAKAAQTEVTLTFSQLADSLQIQIEAELSQWTFTDFFTAMVGRIFQLLAVASNSFIFSTVRTDYLWNNQSITLQPLQNYAALLSVPTLLQPIFALIQNIGNVPTTLPIFGPITVDKTDNENILYPDMSLAAPIGTQAVKIYYLEAKAPFVGFSVETNKVDDEETGELLEDSPATTQNAAMFVGVSIEIKDANDTLIPLTLRAQVQPTGLTFSFIASADPESDARITPDTVIGLMAGNAYLQAVPPQLQQYLTNVGLDSIMISGILQPANLSSIAIGLSSVPNTQLVLFGDPSSNLSFVIQQFYLSWGITAPLEAAARQYAITFETTFTIFPEVFRQADGEPGGEFIVQIDQDFNIDAAFTGEVNMDNLLRTVSAGNIGMPEGVSLSFSDATLAISPSAKSYAFGFVFNASVDFITFDGKPLIQFQEVRFNLAATTPSNSNDKNAKTQYRGSIDGTISVGPISVNTNVLYDGTASIPFWNLRTVLATPVNLSELMQQFFSAYDLPDFLPGSLTVTTFEVNANIPVTKGSANTTQHALMLAAEQIQASYKIAGSVEWRYDGFSGLPIRTTAQIGLAYDGNRPANQTKFSGSVIGDIYLDSLGVEFQVGYRFGPASNEAKALGLSAAQVLAAAGDSKTLWIEWNGIRAAFEQKGEKQSITFSLKGWTVGRILEELVRMVGDPYFSLEAPWDLLNQISLDGLKLTYDLSKGVKYPISASYSLSSPINLGFVVINGLDFKRVEGKVTISISGSTTIPGLQDDPLFKPDGDGQDVKNMPTVPKRGNQYFDLRLLAMGQRVGIVGARKFDSIEDAINKLRGVPSSAGQSNPVNPTSSTAGQPYYSQSHNWLVATDFGILKVGNDYTIELKIVFSDPDLYGLRLAANGTKAKALAGLVIDILYKKVTDDIGLYQLDFSFPSAIRTLQFGTFSITLPEIRIQIYTNGDFLIDFGFPYNQDFSRSFTLQGIIFVGPVPIPLLGSAGFYFGKLSGATAKNLPVTSQGTFNPVIVIGIGLQFGFGKYIEYGPLKAGFSVTAFGIVEGTLAPWLPYKSAPPSNALQSDYYFALQGTFGVIGKLYGTVDFAIIKADVNVEVKIYIQISLIAHRAIPVAITASVSVKISLKVDLGLFSIKISFSFAATITASAKIGSDSQAPWDDSNTFARQSRRLASLTAQPLAPYQLRCKPVARLSEVSKKTLHLVPAPQFTVLTPDSNSTALSSQEGAFVLLFAIDAPTAEDDSGNRAASSFQSLCSELLPWIIDAAKNTSQAEADLAQASASSVTRAELEGILTALSDNAQPPISESQILAFLQTSFIIEISNASTENKAALEGGATLFPPFSGFTITIPNPKGDEPATVSIQLDNYSTITDDYRITLSELFQQLAARVEDESGAAKAQASIRDVTPQAFTPFIFQDYFLLLARQLIQASIDALQDYSYPLQEHDSLQTIYDWAETRGNIVEYSDITEPNLAHPLTAGNGLQLDGLHYVVQADASLQNIASLYTDSATTKRWQTTPAQLIIANQQNNTLIRAGVLLSSQDGSQQYTTAAGDDFASIATGLGVEITTLAQNTTLYDNEKLLFATARMAISTLHYTTAADNSDTLNSIITAFASELALFTANTHNRQLANLFDRQQRPTLKIANLQRLAVSDLWAAIILGDQIAQTAGMAGRYQLHGMRLPKQAGLEVSSNFLYPNDQNSYGLYQLTGQQLPTPAYTENAGYTLSIGKSASLDWLSFAGGAATLDVDLSAQFSQLNIVLDYARKVGYSPEPALQVEALVNLVARQTAIKSVTRWSGADQAVLEKLTTAPGNKTSTNAQRQPLIWALPITLLQQAENRQQRLSAKFSPLDARKYLPVLQPNIGVTDPATVNTSFTAVKDYTFATHVEIEIKSLAQAADLAPDTPFANNVVPSDTGNSGSRARPLAAFSYELIGVSPADAQLLERLLSAMDSLGEALISGLFLAYADNPSAPTALVGQANSAILSFITQSNLSTETNPPRAFNLALASASGNPPRGIANPPAEFIKRLWELSTVRSGGYNLYYEVVDQQVGLPEGLFDSAGNARLSLIITYSRAMEPSDGARLTNYVNAAVTTDAIDLQRSVQLMQSQSNVNSTPKLVGNESLATLATLYGVALSNLLARNSTVTLALGKVIPISGVVHQITPADVNTGDPFSHIASIYAVCAINKDTQKPLTAQDITSFNPGVSASLYSAVRIPELIYSVCDNGPGRTAAEVSKFYHLSLDALAYAMQAVNGLFASGQNLAIDSISLDSQANLGLGNTGIAIQRDNLGTPAKLPQQPTKEEKEAFAKSYLYSLYSLLTSGLHGNAFFSSSQSGLSFGPRKSLTQQQMQAMRDPQSRANLLASQAAAPFDYASTIGFGNFAKINAGADPSGPDLPLKANNPYLGIGSIVQMNLRWVDIFGNRTVTPLVAPSNTATEVLNNPPALVAYADQIIGLSQWPNVRSYYQYGGEPGQPQLALHLLLNIEAYQDVPSLREMTLLGNTAFEQNASNDKALFTRIYYQLTQDYSALGIPGLTGPAITMRLSNRLLRNPEQTLSTSNSQAIIGFVSACVAYITRRSMGQPGGEQPQLILSLPVALSEVSEQNIIDLGLSLTLSRQAALSAPALRAIADGTLVRSQIQPYTDIAASGEASAQPPSQSITPFAIAFERVFVKANDWRLRIGTSAADPQQSLDPDAFVVWAVRMGEREGQGLYFQLGSQPSFFAPAPVAKNLRSETIAIAPYETGQPYPAGETTVTQFHGVDLNTWANAVFVAVDNFLSPTFTSPAFVLDSLLFSDPEKEGYLAKILASKKMLASAISSTVSPVLLSSASDTLSLHSARDKMEQALLKELSSAFTVTALVQFPITYASSNETLSDGMIAPPRFFGQPGGAIAASPTAEEADGSITGNENFSLSTGKIPLEASGGSGDTRLTFLFSSKNLQATLGNAYVPLDLDYALSFVEHRIQSVPGIKNYEQASWISFTTGPFTQRLGSEAINVPVVLRALPQPPTVNAQSFTPGTSESTALAQLASSATPEQLVQWDYHYSYSYEAASQDSVQASTEFNLAENLALAKINTPDLFQSLAQFNAVYPAIANDLANWLVKVNGNSQASDQAVTNAQAAVNALQQITAAVATAYTSWAAVSLAKEAVGAVAKIVFDYDTALVNNNDEARIDIRQIALSPADAKVPAPIVSILPERYQAVVVTPPLPGRLVSYQYRSREDQDVYLSYQDARAVSQRDVRFDRLNIFGYQNAWSSLQIIRNKFLVPAQTTNPLFQFQTPVVKFADPLVPLLRYTDFDLGSLVASPPTELITYLATFFDLLFVNAAAQPLSVKIEAVYSYQLSTAIADLPRTRLPMFFLLPTSFTVQAGNPPAFVSSVTNAVVRWLDNNQPVLNKTAQLNFSVDIFADQAGSDTQKMPLMSIANLYVDANNVKL